MVKWGGTGTQRKNRPESQYFVSGNISDSLPDGVSRVLFVKTQVCSSSSPLLTLEFNYFCAEIRIWKLTCTLPDHFVNQFWDHCSGSLNIPYCLFIATVTNEEFLCGKRTSLWIFPPCSLENKGSEFVFSQVLGFHSYFLCASLRGGIKIAIKR